MILRALMIGLVWATSVSASDCQVLIAQKRTFYPHGWYNYTRAVHINAIELADELLGDTQYQIKKHVFVDFVEFALENAAGHGSQGSGSLVVHAAELREGTLRLTIRNRLLHPVPPRLLGVIFTPDSEPVVIEPHERDREGGVQGKGVRRLFELLPRLVTDEIEVNGPPTMAWREVRTPSGPKVEFEITLPTPTRPLVARPRRPL